MTTVAAGPMRRRRRRMTGMSWIFMIIVMFFVVGAAASFLAPKIPGGRRMFPPVATTPRSLFGVNSFETADGGVTFDSIEAPGSPADKAGLVGGDLITTFDGQQVSNRDQIMDLLQKTPIGKTVDVVFVRDGVTKTTKLTTISEDQLSQLGKIFRARPEGRGKLGISDQELVEVPGTIPDSKIHGVRLGNVDSSMPADMAGLKNGDVIIAMDKVPIRTTAELTFRIQLAVPYSTVIVKIMRGSETIDIPVKMGKMR
jgi:S1-C subfamily serine protease